MKLYLICQVGETTKYKMIIDFLQKGIYLGFPSRKNPRLIISVNSKKDIATSMGLYTPQVLRGKLLKYLYSNLILHVKFIRRFFVVYNLRLKGGFLSSCEGKFKANLSTAVYISTEKDKYVVKLFNEIKTYAYLKVPINTTGVSGINNEISALKTLQKLGVVDFFLDSGFYNNRPYLLIKPLTPVNRFLEKSELLSILNLYKKSEKYSLKNHPRIVQILCDLADSKYGVDHNAV